MTHIQIGLLIIYILGAIMAILKLRRYNITPKWFTLVWVILWPIVLPAVEYIQAYLYFKKKDTFTFFWAKK